MKDLPKLNALGIRNHVRQALEAQADECFAGDGTYQPPEDIIVLTWQLLARETEAEGKPNLFFSDAINGDEKFEAAVLSLAHTGRIVDARDVMDRARELFWAYAESYLKQFEVGLRWYITQPPDED